MAVEVPVGDPSQHILFVVNNYLPSVGGVERHVSGLASRLRDLGHRVTIVALSDHPSETEEPETGLVVRRSRWLRVGTVMSFPLPGETRRLRRRLSELGVTAISVHTRFFPMSSVGITLGRKLGVPVVHTEHGSGFVRGVSAPIAVASRLVDLTVGRRVLRRADLVLAVSDEVAEFVDRLAQVRARVFPNAIDVAAWRRVAPAPTGRFAFVGRLVDGKGWDVLLDAVELLRADSVGRFSVDVYGDGPQRLRLESEIVARRLEDVVEIHGQVDIQGLSAGLAGGILVNPTTLAEGFQTSLIEAIAAGAQIVSYRVPGIDLLASQGAPVRIVGDRSARALAAAMREALVTPLPPLPSEELLRWDWGTRAADYAGLAARAADSRRPLR